MEDNNNLLSECMHNICYFLAKMEHLDKVGELTKEIENIYLKKIDDVSKEEVKLLHKINDLHIIEPIYKELNDETFLKKYFDVYPKFANYMSIIQRKRINELRNRITDKKQLDDSNLFKDIIFEEIRDSVLDETRYILSNLEPYSEKSLALIKCKYDMLINSSLDNLTTNEEILTRRKKNNDILYSEDNIKIQKLHTKANIMAKYCSVLGTDPEITWIKVGNEELVINAIAKTFSKENFSLAFYKEQLMTEALLEREHYKNAIVRYSSRALKKMNRLQMDDYSYFEYNIEPKNNSIMK